MVSSVLCNTIMPTPRASTIRHGSQTSAASTTIEAPSAQITASPGSDTPMPRSHPNQRTMVSSSRISHRPRVQRNLDNSLVVRPRLA